MNGIHDMGGMHGFGAVAPDPDESPFHATWEGRVFALQLLMSVHHQGGADGFRFTLEQIPAADYLRLSYFERWLEALLTLSQSAGVISSEEVAELREGRTPVSAGKIATALPADIMKGVLQHAGGSASPEDGPARAYEVGQDVRARIINPPTHTRLPRYARGRRGVVVADHGVQPFPDSTGSADGAESQRLYGVRFTARELWGNSAPPKDNVNLDLWEPYLEPV